MPLYLSSVLQWLLGSSVYVLPLHAQAVLDFSWATGFLLGSLLHIQGTFTDRPP